MVTNTQTQPQSDSLSIWRKIISNRYFLTNTRLTFSYIILTFGAAFMLFPVIWMASSALKPEWQIFIQPPMIIPQHWNKTEAGVTARLLNLWFASDPDTGQSRETIRLEGRRYSSVIAVTDLPPFQSIPTDELGDASPVAINDTLVNVRNWNGSQVVAVSRNGDDLLVLPIDGLGSVFELPLDEINGGDRENGEIDGYRVQTRIVTLESGESVNLLPLGPQTQLLTMIDSNSVADAIIVPISDVIESDTVAIDRTEILTVMIAGDETNTKYVKVDEANWRPTLRESALLEHAFTVSESAMTINDQLSDFNRSLFRTGTVVGRDGVEQDIAIVINNNTMETTNDNVLVMPVEEIGNAILAPSDTLLRPYPETIRGTVVRVKDFTLPTVNEESLNFERLGDVVGIVGERQDMATIIPVDSITFAYDVPADKIARNTHISFQFSNILDALTREQGGANFFTFIKNSVIVTGMSILGHMFSVTVVAYAFARIRAPGRGLLFSVVLATMMLPEFVTLVPVYTIFRDLGVIDTLWPMFIRTWFGNAFLIFLLRQFFTTIPMELEEAATIDGANRIQIFFRIMLPLITPALATVAIFTFLWSWNDLFHATIFLNTPSNYTVAIGLNQFQGQYESEFNLLMAAASLVMLPTVLLFFFAQRYFIEGITLTGLKG